MNESCPVCVDTVSCKGYRYLWRRIRDEKDPGIRQVLLDRHDRLNAGSNEYPPVTEMIGNAIESGVEFVASGFEIASSSDQESRMAICMSCDRYDQESNRCRACGCFGSLKKRIKSSHCPIGKW